MLALPEMGVVIALRETITLGREESLTADEVLSQNEFPKVPQRRAWRRRQDETR